MLLIVQASKQGTRSDCEYVLLLSGIFALQKPSKQVSCATL